jgi:hypothetical protein
MAKAFQKLNNAAKSLTNSQKQEQRRAFSGAFDDIRNNQNASYSGSVHQRIFAEVSMPHSEEPL